MKSRVMFRWGVVVIVLAAGGYAAFNAWQAAERREILATAAPVPPDLTAWPERMQRRIAAATERVSDGPAAVAALDELSRLYHANGFHAEARVCYHALQRLEPRKALWPYRHGTLVSGFGDVDAALPLLRRAVRLAPEYVPARLRLADVLLKANQVEAAAEAYSAILARHPGQPYAELGLARCDFEAGRWEAARDRLEQLVAQTGYRLGYDLIVTVYEQLGQHERAAAVRGRALASGAYRDPEDPWVDVVLDDCYDPYRLSILAGALAGAGDTAGGRRRLEQAIALSPRNYALHFQLGSLHFASGAFTKAREQFEICTHLAPEFPDGWAWLSELHLKIGDRPAADHTLAEGLERCPESPGLHLMHARRLQAAGRIDEAIAEFRTTIRLRPNEAEAGIDLARLLIAQDRIAEARAELENALVAEPQHPVALGILAFEAITSGNEASARRWVRRVLNQPRTAAEQRKTILDAFRQKFGHRFE